MKVEAHQSSVAAGGWINPNEVPVLRCAMTCLCTFAIPRPIRTTRWSSAYAFCQKLRYVSSATVDWMHMSHEQGAPDGVQHP